MRQKHHTWWLKVVLLFFTGFTCSQYASATTFTGLSQKIRSLAPNGSIILNDETGKQLFSYNPHQSLIPASIVKIVIVLAIYDLLGEDFHFKTEFFNDNQHNLAIKGWGDPFLISEEIEVISAILKQSLPSRINQIYLDTSAFEQNPDVPGISTTLNPYDALNGALVVNFNTLFIGKTKSGSAYSAEEVTPLTPLAIKKSRHIEPGSEERINLTTHPEESLLYVGELFSAFLQKSGMEVKNRQIAGTRIDNSWKLIHRHFNSRSLEFIFSGLMKYSNNFIANQAFLVMGAEKLGYPATLTKSKTVLKKYLKDKWNFREGDVVLEEASGISRNNRMSGHQMMTVLESFRENSHILPGKKKTKIKSGTLTGVYNYAGYIETDHGLQPFVIMTNQPENNRDKILNILKNISNYYSKRGRHE